MPSQLDGLPHVAAGIILEKYNEMSPSGKDWVVYYTCPYTGEENREWRGSAEIKITDRRQGAAQPEGEEIRKLWENKK